jgi:hypothetical protein
LAEYRDERIIRGIIGLFIGGAVGGLLGWIPAGVVTIAWGILSLFTRWPLTNDGASTLSTTLWIVTGVVTAGAGFACGFGTVEEPDFFKRRRAP